MARGDRTKAERREARAAGETKAERKQARAGGGAKAQRKQAKAGRKGRKPPAAAAAPEALAEDASAEERLEWRLARIEEAVAAQSERSEELVAKVDEVLQKSPQSSGPAEDADD
jgi:hypothetical protein